jgi:hypothetical protein
MIQLKSYSAFLVEKHKKNVEQNNREWIPN